MGLLESDVTPYVGMVLATTAKVGLIIISKSAMASGMSNFTFTAYSNALAALLLLPTGLFIHRSPNRPPLTLYLLCGFFLLGILGCLAQLLGYTGINLTSSAYASAMLNLIPGFTFILAIIFRLEQLACRSSSFLAKAIGTVVSIAGAFIVTLYRGPQILNSSLNIVNEHADIPQLNWILGGLFLAADCGASAGFIIVQAFILKKYPAELIMVFFYCFFAGILSAAVSLIVGGDPSAWALQPNVRLIAVLYSISDSCICSTMITSIFHVTKIEQFPMGVFGSAFQVGITSWCLHKRGPLFVAMFYPLSIVIATAFDTILFGEVFYLGSLVGSIIIVVGFYSVMWGKAKENTTEKTEAGTSAPTSEKTPLLPIQDGQAEI
ncbi:WAT1-related protein At3g28050-like [Andrographis paniculata]|uniref:WAT1-related protein At3g28050-like n=1 Tax=Andrographis paniculata TaxID=175694 RepID=UPI0021E76835|nr:WAT1-related protein At3g28050-like [Andrographis paniculata]